MAVIAIILEGRAPKGGGGRGGRGGGGGGGGGGGSSPKNNHKGNGAGSGVGGHRITGYRAPPSAWFMSLPIWARVLFVIGVIWACIIIITFLRFVFVEYKNSKTKGEKFSILNVLKQTFLVACGGYIILWLLRPCANLYNSRKTKKKGDTFYEKVSNAERGQNEGEYPDRQHQGKARPSPTLAPSPPASPVLKSAAAAK